jgi:hypothetical protein
MHCYLFVDCKTPGCNWRHYLKHVEWPTDDHGFIDIPDQCFPLSLRCNCGQAHSYTVKEIQTQTSLTPLHPPDFQSILPDLPAKPMDTN